MSLKFYGPHGVAKETLASGAPIPDGDFFEMTKSDLKEPHNQRLLEEGKVLPATDAATKATKEAVKEAKAEADARAAEIIAHAAEVAETTGENQQGGEGE